LNRIIADNNGFYEILYNMSIKHICCHRSLYPLLITFGLVALLGGQGAAADALDDMRLALRDLLQATRRLSTLSLSPMSPHQHYGLIPVCRGMMS
jgi:hypothetical protein